MVSKQLADAMRAYGSGYALARDTGIAQPIIARFLSGERDLRLATVDRLCKFLGLELKAKGRTKKGGRRR